MAFDALTASGQRTVRRRDVMKIAALAPATTSSSAAIHGVHRLPARGVGSSDVTAARDRGERPTLVEVQVAGPALAIVGKLATSTLLARSSSCKRELRRRSRARQPLRPPAS